MTVVWHHEHHRHERHVAAGRFRMLRTLFFAIVVLVGIVGFGWLYIGGGWRSGKLPRAVESVLFVPIGFGDGHVLWYSTISGIAHGVAAADGRDQVTEADYAQAIEAKIRRNALDDVAKELGVTLDAGVVEAAVTWTDDVREFQRLAGWSDGEYRAYVMSGFVLSGAVEEAILREERYQEASMARLASIQEKLEIGIAFEDVAKEYSEDPVTAQVRGSFGYVSASEVDPGLVSALHLEVDAVSEVLSTEDSYWIVRVEDRVREDVGERVLLRGIAIKKTLLAEVLDAKTEEITPTLFVR